MNNTHNTAMIIVLMVVHHPLFYPDPRKPSIITSHPDRCIHVISPPETLIQDIVLCSYVVVLSVPFVVDLKGHPREFLGVKGGVM